MNYTNATASYPYQAQQTQDLFEKPYGLTLLPRNDTAIKQDAFRILTRVKDKPASIDFSSLKALCEVVQKVESVGCSRIKHSHPKVTSLNLHNKLRHTLFINQLEKTKQVFLSTREVLADSSGTQGFIITHSIMLTFDANSRLAPTVDAIQDTVSLVLNFDPKSPNYAYAERRLFALQALSDCPHFPTNHAYFVYKGKRGTKLRVVQERALCNFLNFHNERQKLNTLTPANKQLICKELLSALHCMENLGLVHRDIKLDNVLVFEELQPSGEKIIHVKLSDLGFVCKTNDLAQLQSLVGSYAWISPELYRRASGDHTAYPTTIRSDIWALGLIVYILCKGHPTPLQNCFFTIVELENAVKAADCVLNNLNCQYVTMEEAQCSMKCYHFLKQLRPNDNFPLIHKDLEMKIFNDREEDRKNLKKAKEQIPILAHSLPASPRTILTLEDLAASMLQENPEARITIAKALLDLEVLRENQLPHKVSSTCT